MFNDIGSYKRNVSKQFDKRNFKRDEVIVAYKRVLGYVRNYSLLLIFGVIAIIIASSVDAGLTWSLKPLLDQGFIDKNQEFISMLPLFVMIAFLLRGGASFLSTYCISSITRNIVMVMRQEIFSKLLTLPAICYDEQTTGQLISTLIYNVNQVSQASASALIILVRETFFIMGLLVVMLMVSWKLTMFFFLTAPLIALAVSYSSKRMRRYSRRVQRGMGDITHIAEEGIEGYRVIRTFGGEEYERDKFNKVTKDNRDREMQVVITNSLASPVVQLIVSVVIAIIIYSATTSIGQITAGGFASMLAAMFAILKPLKNITTINNTIQRGVVGAEGVFELLDQESEEDTGTIQVDRVNGEIEFNKVKFSYKGTEKRILNNINIKIEQGQTVALVGKSGSGKSTLINLLPRFYDGYRGSITIDGIYIRDIKLDALRNQFAFVSQNVMLFDDTVARNIAYGRFSEVSEEEIITAAKAANAWDFISELPEGLNSMVGENGLLLSGGQRQRIAIARALLKDAPILILDEATSSLDSESERVIQEALNNLIKNRTTLIIAHRLSTIENADNIMVLKDGLITEIGKHKDLIALDGEYARLHSLQFKEPTDGYKDQPTNSQIETFLT